MTASDIVASAGAQPRTRRFDSGNRLQLGLFGANCSSGLAATQVPERWDGSWDRNLELARMADDVGLDFMLALARWRGYGGVTDFQGSSLEAIAWACGLLANTRRIKVFSTVHVPFVHPVFAAKQLATVDHIGVGRLGLNIVSGWNDEEFAMFGSALAEHDERYDFSAEWLEIVRKIWSSAEPFDYDGRFFRLRDVVGEPKPWGDTQPPIMSAGASPSGQAFATANCDCIFVTVSTFEAAPKRVEQVRAAAAAHGRDVDVYFPAYIVCRPTMAEAIDYHRYYAQENADWEAADKLMHGLVGESKSWSAEYYEQFRLRFAGGHGCYPIIGDPDHVASELGRIADLGIRGCAMGFVDYIKELPYFRDEVMPRLERLGVGEYERVD